MNRFLHDDRAAMAAEYGLLFIISCGCLAVLAFYIGDSVSAAMTRAADIVSAEIDLIKRGG